MAARGLTAGVAAAIAAGTVRPALFYEGEYQGGTLRLWSGIGPIVWNSLTWVGAGTLASVSPLEETRQTTAVGFTVSLSGMSSALVAIALASVRQGRPGTLWLGFFDAAGALIPDPYQLQRGRLDVSVVEDNGETCTISVQYESRLVDLERPRSRRYTAEDQAIDYPADLGFDAVPGLQDAVIVWGR